jgi:hypothetical protein
MSWRGALRSTCGPCGVACSGASRGSGPRALAGILACSMAARKGLGPPRWLPSATLLLSVAPPAALVG